MALANTTGVVFTIVLPIAIIAAFRHVKHYVIVAFLLQLLALFLLLLAALSLRLCRSDLVTAGGLVLRSPTRLFNTIIFITVVIEDRATLIVVIFDDLSN